MAGLKRGQGTQRPNLCALEFHKCDGHILDRALDVDDHDVGEARPGHVALEVALCRVKLRFV